MKKPAFWFITIVLLVSLVIGSYAVNRGVPGPDDGGAQISQHCTPDQIAAAEARQETVSARGIASFYGVNTNGTTTASGVPLRDSESTAAHRTLPFGTLVRVTNLSNGLRETVEITDRGPYIKGRIIDLSRNAAKKLDMIEAGIVPVEIEVQPAEAKPTPED